MFPSISNVPCKYLIMKEIIKLITFSVVIGLLQSCSTDQPIPEGQLPSFQPKLVVNSALNNLEPIQIKISDNAGAYTNDLPLDYKDVTISLKADGSTVTTTYDAASKSFLSSQSAISGKSYTIEVQDNAGERSTVFARSFIPEQVRNKSIGYIENGGTDMDGRPSDLLSIEWTDQAGSNYYMLHFYYYSETVDLFVPFEFQLNDPSLKAPETMKLNDGGFLFNDVLLTGGLYSSLGGCCKGASYILFDRCVFNSVSISKVLL